MFFLGFISSNRQHPSCDDYLEDKSENHYSSSMLKCIPHLRIIISTSSFYKLKTAHCLRIFCCKWLCSHGVPLKASFRLPLRNNFFFLFLDLHTPILPVLAASDVVRCFVITSCRPGSVMPPFPTLPLSGCCNW